MIEKCSCEDSKRMDWLEENSREEFINPHINDYFTDSRMKWKIPTLISTNCIGSFRTIRQCIDIEREDNND